MPGLKPKGKLPIRVPILSADSTPSVVMKAFSSQVTPLIQKYNEEQDLEKQLAVLNKIKAAVKEIDDTYPSDYFAKSPDYQKACADLYVDMQVQVKSIHEAIEELQKDKSSSDLAKDAIPSLTQIMETMSPDKLNQLTKILQDNDLAALPTLYSENEKHTPEAQHFEKFFKNHTITFIGNLQKMGNSRNYRVTCVTDNSDQVLKVEDRLGIPKKVESHLRARLGENLNPVFAERQGYLLDKDGSTAHRTLIVTKYYEQGSLKEYSEHHDKDEDFLDKIGLFFSQMSSQMLDIQAEGFCFFDAKYTNWLLDKNNKLSVADTKSFLFISQQGNYKNGIPGNEFCIPAVTRGFTPPELNRKTVCSADKIHAFILGKNLYDLIAGKMELRNDVLNFEFTHPNFQTEQGQKYKALIIGLLHYDPAKRMSMAEANHQLFLLAHPDPECVKTFAALRKLCCGENDTVMERYLHEKQKEYARADPADRPRALQEINSSLNHDFAAYEKVRVLIGQYRQQAGRFTVGMNKKANLIESELLKLSAENRRQLGSKSFPALDAALAYQRFGGKTHKDIHGNINEKRAADGYKDFKKFKKSIQAIGKEKEKPEPAPKDTEGPPFKSS